MGERLLGFFDRAAERGGMPAKLRLAALSRMTSSQARAQNDDVDTVTRLELAFESLARELGWSTGSGEFLRPAIPASTHARNDVPRVAGDRTGRLTRQQEVIADLLGQRHLFLSSLQTTAARITESVAHAIDVARVGVWFLSEERDAITCVDLFERDKAEHSSGISLPRSAYPTYFDAIATERTIAANDARVDPRTSCFRESYLEPLGITAMLDVPIWADGKMIGVICHEHVGVDPRTWTEDEERFGFIVGALVALAHEYQRARGDTQAAE